MSVEVKYAPLLLETYWIHMGIEYVTLLYLHGMCLVTNVQI